MYMAITYVLTLAGAISKKDFVLAINSASKYPSYKELKNKEKQEVAVSAVWCENQWPETGIQTPVLRPTT